MGKQNLYEHSTHVPLIIAGPGVKSGQRVSELVWHGDTTATLLDLAGEDVSIARDGRSLVPVLRGEDLLGWREYAGSAYRFAQRSIRDTRWKLIRYIANPDYLEGGEQTPSSDVVQLFDLEHDPWERVNVAWQPELADVRSRLEDALRSWQREVDDPAGRV
jgi:arylsulfatase A-like enzyme